MHGSRKSRFALSLVLVCWVIIDFGSGQVMSSHVLLWSSHMITYIQSVGLYTKSSNWQYLLCCSHWTNANVDTLLRRYYRTYVSSSVDGLGIHRLRSSEHSNDKPKVADLCIRNQDRCMCLWHSSTHGIILVEAESNTGFFTYSAGVLAWHCNSDFHCVSYYKRQQCYLWYCGE